MFYLMLIVCIESQVLGKVPTIQIDKVDSLQVYLSSESLDVEIFSSKSSAVTVAIPKGGSGEYVSFYEFKRHIFLKVVCIPYLNVQVEFPIPEQFKTLVGGRGLVTTPSETVGV